MANIVTLDKGTKKQRYKVTYEVCTADGGRKRSSKTFPVGTKIKEVETFKREMEQKYAKQELTAGQEILLDDLVEEYFSTYTGGLSPYTVANYQNMYNRANGIQEHFGRKKLKDIKTTDVQKYVNKLIAIGQSPKTAKNVKGFFNTLLTLAVRLGYIQSNPLLAVTVPAWQRPDVEVYTLEQVKTLLERSKDDLTTQTIIGLGALAGLRRGELIALKWENVHIDDDKKEIKIEEAAYSVSGRRGTKAPKTKAGRRTVQIPDTLVEILRKQRLAYKQNKIAQGEKFYDEGYVLSQPNGKGYAPVSVYNRYHKFVETQEDIPCIKLHALRHTFASILIDSGVSPKIVQEQLGHADVITTLNIYSHGYDESKKEQARLLDALIKEA